MTINELRSHKRWQEVKVSRAEDISKAEAALTRARTELMETMKRLDRAGEQPNAHRLAGVAVVNIDDAREELTKGERRYVERARKDDELERHENGE